jgi:hypothetical protein
MTTTTTLTESLKLAHTTQTLTATPFGCLVALTNSLGQAWAVTKEEWAARRQALIEDGWR